MTERHIADWFEASDAERLAILSALDQGRRIIQQRYAADGFNIGVNSRGGLRTLGFCCSRRHADFMAEYFNRAGVPSVAVHSGENSAPRASALESLELEDIAVVFAVDMFNEGLDVPAIDTILMLRPTESSTIWQQQFGRGLRTADGTDKDTMIVDGHGLFSV